MPVPEIASTEIIMETAYRQLSMPGIGDLEMTTHEAKTVLLLMWKNHELYKLEPAEREAARIGWEAITRMEEQEHKTCYNCSEEKCHINHDVWAGPCPEWTPKEPTKPLTASTIPEWYRCYVRHS
jgi:hypothetical protein